MTRRPTFSSRIAQAIIAERRDTLNAQVKIFDSTIPLDSSRHCGVNTIGNYVYQCTGLCRGLATLYILSTSDEHIVKPIGSARSGTLCRLLPVSQVDHLRQSQLRRRQPRRH